MRMRLVLALELIERDDTRAPAPQPEKRVVTTTGETVEPRPLAKCAPVVAIEAWRKRRDAR